MLKDVPPEYRKLNLFEYLCPASKNKNRNVTAVRHRKNLLLYPMRTTLLLLFSVAALGGTAQKIEKFYNYLWKPCAPADAAIMP